MTQSYMKGFCKVAEQFGVNPYSLLKYAAGAAPAAAPAQVATPAKDYRAPAVVRAIGRENTPLMWSPSQNEAITLRDTNPGSRDHARANMQNALDFYNTEDARARNDLAVSMGQYGKDWYPAHTNAIAYAMQPYKDLDDKHNAYFQQHWDADIQAGRPGQEEYPDSPYWQMLNEKIPGSELDTINQRYHDSMLAQTGMPQRVSAPVYRNALTRR